jgi:DNA invertase Pin-like site-specific DNA recombinase
MKLIAYIRVSTDLQEKGLGPDVQRQAIRSWAKSNGHRVTAWTDDLGISGSNGLDTRVGLAEALSAVRSGSVGGVVVYRLDRLARDLILQEQLLVEVQRVGGVMFSTSDTENMFLTDDPDDPTRRLVRHVLGALAEWERSLIKLRLQSGRNRKAAIGGYAHGAPPLGYRAQGKALVAEPGERATVERIVALHRGGSSLREIAAALDTEGRRTKRGASWHPTTIARVLRRETVEGLVTASAD